MHIGNVMVPRVSEWGQRKNRKQTESKDSVLQNNTHKKIMHLHVPHLNIIRMFASISDLFQFQQTNQNSNTTVLFCNPLLKYFIVLLDEMLCWLFRNFHVNYTAQILYKTQIYIIR